MAAMEQPPAKPARKLGLVCINDKLAKIKPMESRLKNNQQKSIAKGGKREGARPSPDVGGCAQS
jgi:hypothetical protein